MKINCDLHIHTALSPCSVADMTPNNIVNMSLLNELDVIAITDHNSCENVEAVMKVAAGTELLVIPGMEVETREEIHVVCLFESLEQVMTLQNIVYNELPKLKNKPKIFGEQLRIDHEDEVIDHLDKLLSFATNISIDELVDQVEQLGGICIPAHIDRPSYSIISNLGMIPEHLHFPTLEISRHSVLNEFVDKYSGNRLIQSSDAHELGFIGSCGQVIEVKERTVLSVLQALQSS